MSSTPIIPPFMPQAAPPRRRGAGVVQRLLTLRRPRFSRTRWQAHRDGWRRLLNLGVAASALLLSLPLLLVIAAAVKCSSPGTVFYTQPRVGLNRRRPRTAAQGAGRREHDHGGQVFTIIKFRTMRMRSGGGEEWAHVHDPRVTGVGALLRKHRLDELPQFLNVVRGEMNIVGPRPEQPAIFQQLTTAVNGYARRQRVLPGITGWAQIHHRPDQCIEDVHCKVALDLQYLRRRSAAEDLRIMLRTVPVMLNIGGRIGGHSEGSVGERIEGRVPGRTQVQGLRFGE